VGDTRHNHPDFRRGKQNMKVGDLVKLSMHKTRKGMPYDNTIGVVTEVKPTDEQGWTFVTAVFDSTPYTFPLTDLEVVSESR